MKRHLIYIVIVCFIFLSGESLFAKVELHEFDTPEQQQLYKKLSEELRCLVCQNQNLADSNAELALDMRQQTYEMVKQNQTKEQIVDYWITRYGDFVLYNPPFQRSTLILWLGPFFLLIIGLFFGGKIIKGKNGKSGPSAKDNKDHEAVKKLLSDDGKD